MQALCRLGKEPGNRLGREWRGGRKWGTRKSVWPICAN